MQARYVKGDYRTIDYTPGSAISVGDVIPLGHRTGIAHHDIAANTKGVLAIGGGEYECDGNNDDVQVIGQKLWWDEGNAVGEANSSSQVPLGWATETKASGDTVIRFLHGAW